MNVFAPRWAHWSLSERSHSAPTAPAAPRREKNRRGTRTQATDKTDRIDSEGFVGALPSRGGTFRAAPATPPCRICQERKAQGVAVLLCPACGFHATFTGAGSHLRSRGPAGSAPREAGGLRLVSRAGGGA